MEKLMISICLLALTLLSIRVIIIAIVLIVSGLYEIINKSIYTIRKWNRNRLSKKKVHINGDKCGERCKHLPIPVVASKSWIYKTHGNNELYDIKMQCSRYPKYLKHTHDYNYDLTSVLSTFTRCDECLKEFPIKKKGKK